MNASFDVIFPAAGSGSRFGGSGGGGDKLLTDIVGRSVLERSVAAFAVRDDVASIVLVTAPDRFDPYRVNLHNVLFGKPLHFVAGGRERWESVLFGLRFLATRPDRQPFVAIHDAARPLVPPTVITTAFRTAAERGAALPAVPEPATLKRQDTKGCIAETVNRRGLFQAQTPQCFDAARLLLAYEQLLSHDALADVTDDAQVLERVGFAVPITTGSPLNIKITTAADVAFARALATLPSDTVA
jgi:2-C-methyl-D-erythritol 4-phosphate cytidylyltransferase